MKEFKHTVLEMAETFAVSFVIIMILYGLIASIEIISGASMEPGFLDKERILVDRVSPIIDDYRRGDVVVFTPPSDHRAHYIKRVVGMPGESIKVFDCKVYVSKDGSKYEIVENYLGKGVCTYGGLALRDGRSYVIPEGQYAVFGDNREASVDSRYFGFIERKSIIGRVVFLLWPIGKIGFVN